MDAPQNADDFIQAALAVYGVEADAIELAVMGAAHQMLWPPIRELLELDTGAGAGAHDLDLSRAPEQ